MVTAIVGVVSLAVFSTMSQGIEIWQRISRESLIEDVSIFFDRFTSDLRNTTPIISIHFAGESDELSFPTRIIYRTGEEVKKEIGRVDYFWDRRDGAITRESRSYSQVYRRWEGTRRILARNITSFQIRYFWFDEDVKSYSWAYSWEQDDIELQKEKRQSLPLAVRVALTVEEGDFERKFTRTIFVPAGCCPAEEEIPPVGGLSEDRQEESQ